MHAVCAFPANKRPKKTTAPFLTTRRFLFDAVARLSRHLPAQKLSQLCRAHRRAVSACQNAAVCLTRLEIWFISCSSRSTSRFSLAVLRSTEDRLQE